MKNWSEDFGDEPAVEERAPHGMSPLEMAAVCEESHFGTCECCGDRLLLEALTCTGDYEFHTMDIDHDSLYCGECYESIRLQYVPSDPSLWDCLTPVAVA